jgi:tetratricopeptide (TPR) repeat protein
VNKQSRSFERASRIYRVLLRLYPKGHRELFGAEMLRTFKDEYRDAQEEGRVGLGFWGAVTRDEFENVAHEYLSTFRALRLGPIIVLLGGAEFAALSMFRPKHLPIPAVAALLLLPLLAIGAAVLLMATVLTKWAGNWKVVGAVSVAGVALVIVGVHGAVQAAQTNTWCSSSHVTTSQPPRNLNTAADYFAQGDYDYDRGQCDRAITDYTHAIELNPRFAEAYNNRAYTYMMEKKYQPALDDLNQAIEIRPDYAHALMNRGDVYNYGLVDRPLAIADYNRLIALGPAATADTQVCGHLFYALHNGWHLKTILDLPHSGCSGG